jgi:putative peptidoglycan lipid II flippase
VQDRKKSGRSVEFQAALMSMGTLISRFLGLARESLFAALFPRWITDSWYVAFKLPNIFRRLFGEGSLSVSFIPIFIEAQKEKRAEELVSGFFFIFSIFLLSLSALGILLMDKWLPLFLDQAYIAQVEKFEMTLVMARIMFGYIYLVCTYAFIMAILNAVGHFGRAAIAPAFFNLIIIASTLVPKEYLKWEGQAIAWGVILGGLVQLGVLIPALIRTGYFPKIEFRWNLDIKRVFVNMLPGLAGMGLFQVMTLANMWFASRLENGVISYITLADRILELPLSLISVSLGVALLPTLSRIWLSGDKKHFSEVSSYHLKLNLFLSLPCAIGAYVLAEPIVELLFQRGQFTVVETQTTALILRIYSFLIVISSVVRVFVPNFYAIKNTWYPALVSGICLVFHLLLTPILMKLFSLTGLISGTVISSGLNLLLLAVGYYFLIGPYPWIAILGRFIKFCIPGFIMLFSLHLYPYCRETLGVSFFGKFISLLIVMTFSGFLYFMISYWLKLPEIRHVTKKLSHRLQFKL